MNLNYKIIIASKERELNVKKNKQMYGDNVCFCVHESEVKKYIDHGADKKTILPHTVDYPLAKIINFIIQHCIDNKIEYLVLLDDDIKSFVYRVGYKEREYTQAKDIVKIIENGVTLLEDAGKDMYQASSSLGIIRYMQNTPYKTSGGVLNGYHILRVNKKYKRPMRYLMHCDVGLSLQILLHSRYAIIEERLYLKAEYQTNSGGMQGIRTTERIEKSLNELKEEWGCNILIVENKTGNITPRINVVRKQK